ncbi:MAG: Ig-like domain-containing protein, partial [Candidatus Kerfeldbacteria bacterium]|nr:Ig-like domain-containing protein [Candidatus Kerfeldbacteria bacterium]
GTATTLQTVTITVTNANQSPVFSGTLPSVSFVPGTITTTVFDLDDYFTDPDSDLLAYTVSGAILITVTITDGAVSLSAAEAISATEDLVFTATDPTGDTATSNTVAVIVTPEEASEVDIADVSHVSGSTTGEGTITIVGTDGSTLASWKAFSVGGVIPRIIKARNQYYILTVKRRSGSSIHAYTLHGSVVSNQNISPQVHYRKLAVGNLNADTTTEELVLGTRRDSKIYFKVLSFDPKKGRFTITKRAIYNGPIKTNDYALVIVQKTVTLFTKGVPRFNWKALGH